MPRQGLGNSAIASVADDEQHARFDGRWAAMAITEPEAGSDSAAIRTTAVLDGDEYVLNGEKIYVTAGERADLVVVWATLDRSRAARAIKSFVVERSNPGLILERLETSSASARPTPRRSGSRTAGCRRRTCSARRRSRPAQVFAGRHADVRQHPPARRRDGRRPRAGVPGGDRRSSWARPASRSTGTARRASSPRRPPSCWRWRPTTRPRGC